MDSIDSLLAIQLPPSDSESASFTSATMSSDNEDAATDAEDDVNNEDDQMEAASDDDDEDDEAVIYAEDVIHSTGSSSSRYTAAVTDNVSVPPTSSQLPVALSYTTPPAPLPPSSGMPSLFVPPTSSAAASAAKGPPTPVIVTATPLPSLGPLRPQTEYEPAASAAATRLAAQYTDSLRRRADALIQKRLRVQKESTQKAKEIRQLTGRLAELNARLGDELVEQKRLVADYDRVRETAQRALGVLRLIRDAETVLADTKDQLLATLAQRDGSPAVHHQQTSRQASASAATDDDVDDSKQLTSATVAYDPLGLD